MAQGEINKVTITIETTNAAFESDYDERDDSGVFAEVNRILLTGGVGASRVLYDIAGNQVGIVTVEREK